MPTKKVVKKVTKKVARKTAKTAPKKTVKKSTDNTCTDCGGTGLYGPNLPKNEQVICSPCVGSGKI